MLNALSFLCKTLPAFYFTYRLNIFARDAFRLIEHQWVKGLITYGSFSALVLGVILYFLIFRDAMTRQQAKESDEDESRLYTAEIQTKRMFRKYFPLGIVGIIAFVIYLLYKPLLVALAFRVSVIYAFFILGEFIRIWDLAIKENKRNKKALG
jgi:hypothetical protein